MLMPADGMVAATQLLKRDFGTSRWQLADKLGCPSNELTTSAERPEGPRYGCGRGTDRAVAQPELANRDERASLLRRF
jgi:hypothetical protein